MAAIQPRLLPSRIAAVSVGSIVAVAISVMQTDVAISIQQMEKNDQVKEASAASARKHFRLRIGNAMTMASVLPSMMELILIVSTSVLIYNLVVYFH